MPCITFAQFLAPFGTFFVELKRNPIVLLTSTPYISDLGSDITVGVRYLQNEDYWWGVLTLILAVIPLFVSFGNTFGIDNGRRLGSVYNVGAIFSLMGLDPIATKLSMKYHAPDGQSPNPQLVQRQAWCTSMSLFWEATCEAIPQLMLQLYIAGQSNKVDRLQLFTIATSFFSASTTLINYHFFCFVCDDEMKPRLAVTLPRTAVGMFLLLPSSFLGLACLFGPVALRADLAYAADWRVGIFLGIILITLIVWLFILLYYGDEFVRSEAGKAARIAYLGKILGDSKKVVHLAFSA